MEIWLSTCLLKKVVLLKLSWITAPIKVRRKAVVYTGVGSLFVNGDWLWNFKVVTLLSLTKHNAVGRLHRLHQARHPAFSDQNTKTWSPGVQRKSCHHQAVTLVWFSPCGVETVRSLNLTPLRIENVKQRGSRKETDAHPPGSESLWLAWVGFC